VTFHRNTAAEDTAAILQAATHGGAPVLIPGAREVRAGRASAPHVAAAVVPVVFQQPAPAAPDRGQLEYERQGGGAPSERQSASHRTPVARLRDWLFRRV
jgi:hypothetical protein